MSRWNDVGNFKSFSIVFRVLLFIIFFDVFLVGLVHHEFAMKRKARKVDPGPLWVEVAESVCLVVVSCRPSQLEPFMGLLYPSER